MLQYSKIIRQWSSTQHFCLNASSQEIHSSIIYNGTSALATQSKTRLIQHIQIKKKIKINSFLFHKIMNHKFYWRNMAVW
jgi:hypothetical protein